MKKTILLRGCQGSGKTSLIRRYGLGRYAIGFDAFRELYAAAVPTLDGDEALVVGPNAEKQAVAATKAAVENRMSLGATVVLDAMNLSAKAQGSWAELGRKYGYETLLIDVQGEAADAELLERNALRGAGRVSEDVLLSCAAQGREQALHPMVRQITAEDLSEELSSPVVDLSAYRKVVVVGDVHSCAAPLAQAIAEHGDLDDQTIAWIFLGDLFDRGPDAAAVFDLVAQDRPNVFLLEGNHETNLRLVMTGAAPKGRFADARTTRDQILSAGHEPREITRLLAGLLPVMVFEFCGQQFVATHGGVRSWVVRCRTGSGRLHHADIPDYHFIYGASERSQTHRRMTDYGHLDEQLTGGEIVQFHGHRNGGRAQEPQPLGSVDGVWNLEAGVESGGHLAVAVIDIKGRVTAHRYASPTAAAREPLTVDQQLAAHPDIRTRDIGEGITAYNFTRDAFNRGRWDALSTAARGLFMRGDTVVARGYEKFFNLGEIGGFTREQVLEGFTLPVRVSQKVNGFLLIASSIGGRLRLFSKSGPTDFAEAGRDLFERVFDAEKREAFRSLLERTNTSVTFEAILANDPHLIGYDTEQIVFLDVIENSLDFRIRTDLERAVESILQMPRTPSVTVDTRDELAAVLLDAELSGDEGAVLRDAEGRMTKVKAEGYRRDKRLRGALNRVLTGKAEHLPAGDPVLADYELRLRESGVWDRLSEYTVVNPVGQVVLHMPRILAAVDLVPAR